MSTEKSFYKFLDLENMQKNFTLFGIQGNEKLGIREDAQNFKYLSLWNIFYRRRNVILVHFLK